MQRREFLLLAGAATALPYRAFAQQSKVPRVALISGAVPVTSMTATGDPTWAAFIQEMARLGYLEGKSIIFERYVASVPAAPQVAGIVIASSPDVVFSNSLTALLAVMALSKTVPIVGHSTDPVSSGLVSSLAHPGGNVTAIGSGATPDVDAKNVELLAQTLPSARRLAYYGPGDGGKPDTGTQANVQAAMTAALKLSLSFTDIVVENPADETEYRRAFAVAMSTKPDMVQIGLGSVTDAGSPLLGQLALDARVPAISPNATFARAGGLIGHGSNAPDNHRKAADYVALILNGAKPGDLPVLLPTAFDFVINQKTAKALGITVPPSVLLQATEVIR